MTCAHCGRLPCRWHQPLVLATGAPSCNFSAAWQAECRERHDRVLRCLRLDDREARRDFIARYERTAADTAPPGTPDRAAYAAEARRRLEAAVLDYWERKRAARAVA